MEALSVRFHYRGRMEWHEKKWIYIGGRSSSSVVPVSKLSVEVLKMHLADHIMITNEDLQETCRGATFRVPHGGGTWVTPREAH